MQTGTPVTEFGCDGIPSASRWDEEEWYRGRQILDFALSSLWLSRWITRGEGVFLFYLQACRT